jgi:two-component system chemotaxis sensor kinase CheA
MGSTTEILSELTSGLIGWEDGDLLGLSALADLAQTLGSCWAPEEESAVLANHIADLFSQTLSGTLSELPKDELNRSVERLSQWMEARELSAPAPDAWKSASDERAAPQQDGSSGTVIEITEPVSIFLAEAQERLTEAQSLVLDWESNLDNSEPVNVLFRIFHTIKGECGFLKIVNLGELAHSIENLLDLLRSHSVEADDAVIEILFQGIDMANDILESIASRVPQRSTDDNLHEFLARVQAKNSGSRKPIGEILKTSGKLTEQEVDKILVAQKASAFTKKFGEIATEVDLITGMDVAESILKQKTAADEKELVRHDPFIKVKASQVNYLVDMVGELLIVENQLNEDDKNLVTLKKISKTIQTAVMQLRTVKVKSLFINLKRLARDAARQVGKTVLVDTRGEDLEVDRNLVELLEEPLLHLVRNCVGHGIETAEKRKAAGKPETGTILVSALRQGNSITIAVRDDGGGLNVEKILDTAVAKGLVAPDRRQSLTTNEIYNLIFLPGFSTAEQVNAISGRGVGMDIVKSTVTAGRGRVETRSEPGKFTEFSLVFPLSLAIIDGMIVTCAGIHYVVPVASITESLKIRAEDLSTVEGQVNVLEVRDEILPVIFLKEFFHGTLPEDRGGFAIVVIHENQKFALIVDSIVAKKEVAIKSLGKRFQRLPAITSASVLAGGHIAFVVNVEDIVRA